MKYNEIKEMVENSTNDELATTAKVVAAHHKSGAITTPDMQIFLNFIAQRLRASK